MMFDWVVVIFPLGHVAKFDRLGRLICVHGPNVQLMDAKAKRHRQSDKEKPQGNKSFPVTGPSFWRG